MRLIRELVRKNIRGSAKDNLRDLEGWFGLETLFEKGLAWTGLAFIREGVGLDWTRLYSRRGWPGLD